MSIKHIAGITCIALSALAAVPFALGGVGRGAASGSLSFRGTLALKATDGDCPGGRDLFTCLSTVGTGIVPGLGKVSESYVRRIEEGPAGCDREYYRILSQTVRLTVAGKGEIQLVVPETGCIPNSALSLPDYPQFTITGGSGAYAGASGTGTLEQRTTFAGAGLVGTDRWVGNLVVPGLEFDVTAPRVSHPAAKTVRAPKGATRVRVGYTVAASDAVDGKLPVSCQPRSGSRFRIGRTTVRCSAIDRSGNTGTARFAVTVKAHG